MSEPTYTTECTTNRATDARQNGTVNPTVKRKRLEDMTASEIKAWGLMQQEKKRVGQQKRRQKKTTAGLHAVSFWLSEKVYQQYKTNPETVFPIIVDEGVNRESFKAGKRKICLRKDENDGKFYLAIVRNDNIGGIS